MEKSEIAGDNRPQPVGCRWTTSCTGCGTFLCPQPVEILRPRIHRQVTCPDRPAPRAPVDTVWTTSQSPGCGREKVTESVESGRNPAGNRTPDDRRPTPAARDRTPIRADPGRIGARSGSSGGPSGSREGRFGGTAGRGWGGRWAADGPGAGDAGRRRWAWAWAVGMGGSGGSGPRVEARGPVQARGHLRTTKGVPGGSPGTPWAAGRLGRPRGGQPFLMRLVSSVTWL